MATTSRRQLVGLLGGIGASLAGTVLAGIDGDQAQAAGAAAGAGRGSKPNVVIIFIDDMGDYKRKGTGSREPGFVKDPVFIVKQESSTEETP